MELQRLVLQLDYDGLMMLSGPNDSHIKRLEELYDTTVYIKGDAIYIMTQDADKLATFKEHIDSLIKIIGDHRPIDVDTVSYAYDAISKDAKSKYDGLAKKVILTDYSNRPIKAKTVGQMEMTQAIDRDTITIVDGPAGSGKTFLAVVMAVKALKEGACKKIVLTRPVVEAGESLGFLPGDLKEKVDPYLMPLYDALDSLLGHEKVEAYIDKKIIEIIPLAYMRGRSLNDAFIILDEAQNTTSVQMLMFLTRLGKASKMVITGDLSQIDRQATRSLSGLDEAIQRLKKTEDIAIIKLDDTDIVRHPLVKKIIERYSD